jgi:hypothetical protein
LQTGFGISIATKPPGKAIRDAPILQEPQIQPISGLLAEFGSGGRLYTDAEDMRKQYVEYDTAHLSV